MPERFSRSSVHLDVSAGESPAHEVPSSDTPFQILLVGDFSGRANRGLRAPLAGRRPVSIDCDNLDEAIANMNVALELPRASLQFRELDDFHPDHLYRNAEIFRKLEDMRDQPPKPSSAPSPAAQRPEVRPEVQPGRSLLDQMMEGESSTERAPESAPARATDTLADFINKAMAPHLERPDAVKQQWSARVDAVAGEQMRGVLHDAQFQAVEAAWRGAQMLVQRLDPDSELRLYLLDATLDELLDAPQEFAKWIAGSRGPWALMVGNFAFGQSAHDSGRLLTLGRIAAAAGAPLLAEGQPPSGDEPAPEWAALRSGGEARWIGLALPRFLLRLPYGKATSEVESFHFEEMPESVHARYLWGNPAIACACLVGKAFRKEGWDLRPGRGQIAGLPLHLYKEGGETVAKPCAEILLTEHDAEYLLENGLMPVASMKDQDAIIVPRIQSIADPATPLAGRWNAG